MIHRLLCTSIENKMDNITDTVPTSSLVCNNGTCIFTRIDTNAPADIPSFCYEDDDMFPPGLMGGESSAPSSVFVEEPPSTGSGNRMRGLRSKRNLHTVAPSTFDPFEDEETPVPADEEECVDTTTSAPWTDPDNQDKISDTVALTRDFRGGLINAFHPVSQYSTYMGPYGTEWARLPEGKSVEEARCALQFCSLRDCFAQGNMKDIPNKPGVLHLLQEDEYYNIEFLSWTPGRLDDYGSSNPVGGGFSYKRDETPFTLSGNLSECPNCNNARANPSTLSGPLDDSFVEVKVDRVTPETADITIKAVAQDRHPSCNSAQLANYSPGRVEPNAMGIGKSTVMLRRTRILGQLHQFGYTVYFNASTEAGFCDGSVDVCVPPPGFTGCENYNVWGYDATADIICQELLFPPYYRMRLN